MGKGFQGTLMRHLGATEHRTTVRAVEMVAPHMRRIRFHAPTAFADIVLTPGTYVRGWFPDDSGKEHQRGYTLIEIDEDAHEYSIDFLLHVPSGPAGQWAANAEVGDELVVSPFGVRPFEVPDPLPRGYLLIADAAGIPCVRELADYIPDSIPIELYVGQYHEEDRDIPLPERENLRVHWIPMHSDDALAAALEQRDWQEWKAVVIAESAAGRHCRKYLQQQAGFPRSEISGQAYWKAGKQMGTSRDLELSAPATASPKTDASSAQPTRTWKNHRGRELLAPVRPALWIAGIAEIAITVVQLLPYLILVEMVRTLLADSPQASQVEHIRYLWLVFLIVFGLGATLASVSVLAMHLVDARFTYGLRRRLIRQLTRLPLQWFTERSRSTISAVVRDDTLALHALITHAVPAAVSAVASPLLILAYLFYVDWRIALALLVPIVVALWLMYVMIFRSFDAAVAAPARARRMQAQARAYVEAHHVVATFPHTARFYRDGLAEYLNFLRTWQLPFANLKTALTLVTRPITLLTLIVAVATPLVLTGSTPVPDALTFVFIGTTFASALLAIGYQLQEVRAGLEAANRIAAVQWEPPLPQCETSRAAVTSSAVRIREVEYGYRPDSPVLHGISLDIPAGTRCALVGPSGAGKSTLAYLLARFADPDHGTIQLGGVDIRDLTTADLYRHIGFVFQDVELLEASIHDNISLGKPGACHDDVIAAAKAAHIHERICALPQGYSTVITDRTGLSGGELQRITIARLFLADLPVVILDEATAYADPVCEQAVHAALAKLTQGRTVVMIAHRLETITDYDMIVVIDGGRIAQCGTHSELLAQGGRYQQMWEARL